MREQWKQHEPISSALIEKARKTIAHANEAVREQQQAWAEFAAFAERVNRQKFLAIRARRGLL